MGHLPETLSPKILLVDDNAQIRNLFNRTLSARGYRVVECVDGREAIDIVESEKPALIILDVDMPRLDGWKTLAELRRRGCTQLVLMITHVNDLESRVKGLEGGADDYLSKPCEASELLARVGALLRRNSARPTVANKLHFGSLIVDLERKCAFDEDQPVHFTRTEYTLLQILVQQSGKPVPRDVLQARLWGGDAGRSHTIDSHLWRLRKKLGKPARNPPWIQSLKGIGYVLHQDPIADSPKNANSA
jgi:DNA-binding response OmpR family regulator